MWNRATHWPVSASQKRNGGLSHAYALYVDGFGFAAVTGAALGHAEMPCPLHDAASPRSVGRRYNSAPTPGAGVAVCEIEAVDDTLDVGDSDGEAPTERLEVGDVVAVADELIEGVGVAEKAAINAAARSRTSAGESA